MKFVSLMTIKGHVQSLASSATRKLTALRTLHIRDSKSCHIRNMLYARGWYILYLVRHQFTRQSTGESKVSQTPGTNWWDLLCLQCVHLKGVVGLKVLWKADVLKGSHLPFSRVDLRRERIAQETREESLPARLSPSTVHHEISFILSRAWIWDILY